MGGARAWVVAAAAALVWAAPAEAYMSRFFEGSVSQTLGAQPGAVDFTLANLDDTKGKDIAAFVGGSGNFFLSRQLGGTSAGPYTLSGVNEQLSTPGAILAAQFHNASPLDDVLVSYRADGHNQLRLASGTGTSSVLPFELPGVPRRMVAGDFDQDGNLDFAALVDTGAMLIAVELGDGLGGFTDAPGSPFAAGPGVVRDIATADATGDGRLDLIVTGAVGDPAVGSVRVLRGVTPSPGGVAAPPLFDETLTVSETGGSAATLDTAYMDDADRNVDVVVGLPAENKVAVLLGVGNGRFNPAPSSPYATAGTNGTSMATVVGDLDGDGSADVVTSGNGVRAITPLRNQGDGRLKPMYGLGNLDIHGADTVSMVLDTRTNAARPNLILLEAHDGVSGGVGSGPPIIETFLNLVYADLEPVDAASADLSATVGSSATGTLVVKNKGDGGAILRPLTPEPSGVWKVLDPNGCADVVLAPGAQCEFTVRFTPVAVGTADATLTVTTGETRAQPPAVFTLHGVGTPAPVPDPQPATPTLDIKPRPIDFGNAEYGLGIRDAILTFRASGKPVTITGTKISGPDATLFHVLDFDATDKTIAAQCPKFPVTLAPGQVCRRWARFRPGGDLKVLTATLVVNSNAITAGIPLKGRAVDWPKNACGDPNCVWTPYFYGVVNPQDSGLPVPGSKPKTGTTRTVKAGDKIDATAAPVVLSTTAGTATLSGAAYRLGTSKPKPKARAAAVSRSTELSIVTKRSCGGGALLAKGTLDLTPVKSGRFVLKLRAKTDVLVTKAARIVVTERCGRSIVTVLRGQVKVGSRTVKAGQSRTVRP